MMEFDAKVKTIDDLQEGMILNGIVTNITQFGCFVDIGIKEKRISTYLANGRPIYLQSGRDRLYAPTG